MTVAWDEIRARRLERSSLDPRATDDALVDVVRAVGGIHAQVQASAELQLAARVDDLRRVDVRDALWERKSLAKAWTIRGTLHLHAADELALWLAARRAVDDEPAGAAPWRDPNGVVHPALGAEEVEAIVDAVWAALDGRCLRRDELLEALDPELPAAASARLRSGFAFFLGALCQGPPQGQRVTLARPDQWLADWQDVDPEHALHEVCRRFVAAYGPTRPADFAEWFGGRLFPAAAARAVFEGLAAELEEVAVDGRIAYVLAGDAGFAPLRPSLRLLPEYDVYVMGFRERDHLVPEPLRAAIAAHGRGRYEGPAGVRLLLVDGVGAGLWERVRRGGRLDLRVVPSGRLRGGARDALSREADRIGAFLGCGVDLAVER